MDRSIPYADVMSNFNSAYNTSPTFIHQPTMYIPISSSSSFQSHSNRSISPSLRSSNPKFNLDLYKPNEYYSESSEYSSPASSVIIHHHPVYSPPPPSSSQTISKLRQLNDELCQTLAQCELTNQSEPSPSHYHIHHYPVPQHSYENYRSRSISERDSSLSSAESEPIIKKRNAKLTYKIHIPRRQKENSLSKLDQVLISTSDAYTNDDPMTIDLYPTRDQGFVKQIRNRPDNQSPWLINHSSVRRNSYSDASTYRSPRTSRGPDYSDKPITPKSRLIRERPPSGPVRRSPFINPRIRPDSAPNPLRQSAVYFSNTGPSWRPNGTIKPSKFIGSNAPPSKPKPLPPEPTWNPAGGVNKIKPFRSFDPRSELPTKIHEPTWNPAGVVNKTKPVRAFDPRSESPTKTYEPIWNPPSKGFAEKPPKYFEPNLKPELIAPIRKVSQRKTIKNQPTIRSGDPKLKTRIAKAESKVKSAWQPTTDGITQSTIKERKPPIPRPIKTTTTTIPPKPKVKSVPSQPTVPIKKVITAPPPTTDTGRSSLNDVPTKPLFQSTPMNQSVVDESMTDLFENESQTLEPLKKQEISRPPLRIEKTPTELPKTTAPEPDKTTKSTIKDASSPISKINNNNDDDEEPLDDRSLQPSPILPERKATSPKPDIRDDVSIVDDATLPNQNDSNAGIERSFEMNKTLDDASKAVIGPSKKDDVISPSITPQIPPKADVKTPTRRKEPSPSPPPESPDQNSYISSSDPKKNDKQLPSTPPPPPPPPATTTTAGATADVDDFFD